MKHWKIWGTAFFGLCGLANPVAAQALSPKGHSFAGLEGSATVASNSPYNQISASVAAVGEHYFANQWSLGLRLRITKYNLNESRGGTQTTTSSSGGMGPSLAGMFSQSTGFIDYESTQVAVPLSLKWNFRIFRSVHGFLRTGPSLSVKLNSKYENSEQLEVQDKVFSPGWESGGGMHFQFKNSGMLFVDYSFGTGPAPATFSSLGIQPPSRAANHYIGLGYLWKVK